MQNTVMAKKINHCDYEKIIDELMWLNKNWMLKFCVVLNKVSDKFGKVNYHKEVGYYKDGKYCVNINRSFDYYLIIESTKSINGQKESVIIRNTEIYLLKYKLNLVSEWFTAEKHQGLLAKKNGNKFIPTAVNPIKINNLALNKYIEFEPSILNLDNGDQIIGVRIYMNNDLNSFFMDINKFLGFKYFIDTFNMYQSAVMMINYLQRPEYGSYIYNVNNNAKQNNKQHFIT